MPLPKRKTSLAQTRRRRANNWKLKVPNVATCPRCHAPKLSHHVCPACGFYENKMIIDVRSRQRRGEEPGGGDAHAGHTHDGE